MKKIVDVCGLSCPEPVLKLKGAINAANEIELHADSRTTVENCLRFAESKGFVATVREDGSQFTVSLAKLK